MLVSLCIPMRLFLCVFLSFSVCLSIYLSRCLSMCLCLSTPNLNQDFNRPILKDQSNCDYKTEKYSYPSQNHGSGANSTIDVSISKTLDKRSSSRATDVLPEHRYKAENGGDCDCRQCHVQDKFGWKRLYVAYGSPLISLLAPSWVP